MHNSQPRPCWRGFPFALHLTRCRAFIFARRRVSRLQAFTAAFISSMKLYIQNIKTVHRALQRLSVDLTYYSAHNTAAAQAAYTPTATRWRAYRQAQHPHRYQIQPTRRTLYRPAQPPYYNKVYRGATVRPVMDPCQTVQHITDRASLAVCRYFPRLAAGALAWVSLALAWHYVFSWHGGTEPLAATAAPLFGLSPDS